MSVTSGRECGGDGMRSSFVQPGAQQRLPFRHRPDLEVSEQAIRGRKQWVVKDPVGLRYFRFCPQEYAVLKMLDGSTNLQQIKTQLDGEFSPETVSLDDVWQLICRFHRNGLIVARTTGEGEALKQRRDERARRQRWASCTNPLAIRFQGVDPDALLSRIYPFVRWMFTRTAVATGLTLILSAVALLAVHFETLQSRLPAFQQFFGMHNLLWLAIAMAGAKVLHEFGHGLTCKHFGGESHEMGVMLLVFMPCLYCNVSDSWMFPKSRQRIAVAAAGMYVELLLAALATWLWWCTAPGLVHYLCLNLMFTCSVSTLLFNANPLLRYDGYYILSDISGIPNLYRKSRTILVGLLGRLCLGVKGRDVSPTSRRSRSFLAAYGVASVIYRVVIAFSILWFLYNVLKPYGLQLFALGLASLVLFSLIVLPLWRLVSYLRAPGRMKQVKIPRLAIATLSVSAAIVVIAFVPLPSHVIAPAVVEPANAERVFVIVPGRLKSVPTRVGRIVQAGDPIAVLINEDVEENLIQLKHERGRLLQRLESVRRRRFIEARVGAQVAELKQAIAAVEEHIRQESARQESLVLRAKRTGMVFPVDYSTPQPPTEDTLTTWSGDPLSAENRGSFLESGVELCTLGDPNAMEVLVVVDEWERDRFTAGEQIELKFDHLPSEVLTGRIIAISRQKATAAPRQLSTKRGGELPTKTTRNGIERPQSASIFVRVRVEDSRDLLIPGLRGRAKIQTGSRSLGSRLYGFVRRVLMFR